MFTRSIAVFVAAVVLVTGSPAMAQSSDLLASAERAALMMEVEQDQAVVQRRRSSGLAWIGGGLAVGGVVLALQKGETDTFTTIQPGGSSVSWTPDRGSTSSRRYWGIAAVAGGGALMWFGLRAVDVPVRLDMAPAGGFRVSRSLSW